MIERARLKRRRLKYPVSYWAFTTLQCVVVFALVFYYATIASRSPKVRIEFAEVDGNRALSSEPLLALVRTPLDSKIARFIRRDNQWLYPASEVRTLVIDSDPRINDAEVKVKGHDISLSIKERTPEFRYCVPVFTGTSSLSSLELPSKAISLEQATAAVDASSTVVDVHSPHLTVLPMPAIDVGTHSCYWVDKTGFAFARAPDYSGSPLLTFIEGDTSKFEGTASSTRSPVGSVVLDDDTRKYGDTLREELSREDIVVYNYELLPDGDIRVHSGLSYPFIVSMRKEPASEVSMLTTAIVLFKKNPSDTPKQYLDLRFKDKIFYQ